MRAMRWGLLLATLLASIGCDGPCDFDAPRVGGTCVYTCGGHPCLRDGSLNVGVDATGVDAPALDVAPACEAPSLMCGARCLDVTSDLANCGGCGHVCGGSGAMHGSASCVEGSCYLACAEGFADCDGDAANGCEVDLATDVVHCGTCATRCMAAFHASATCTAGVCGIECAADYSDCDLNSANGCEAHVPTDPMNCGQCGTVCAVPDHSNATCTNGYCSSLCRSDAQGVWEDCNGFDGDGCERNLEYACDACGACGRACSSTQRCSMGVCVAESDPRLRCP